MRRIAVLLAIALSLSACSAASTGPIVIIPTSAETLERAEYSEIQIENYKQALKREVEQLNLMKGMVFEFDQPDENWIPFVARAKAFCDTARTQSWQIAETQYVDQVILEASNALPTEIANGEDSNAKMLEVIMPLANAQFRAFGAPGSLCPDLAPDFALSDSDSEVSPIETSPPILEGQYFGEGCEGAGQALFALLEFLDDIKNGQGTMDAMNDRLRNIAAGLVYAELSESNPKLAKVISGAIPPVIEMQIGFENQDPEKFSAAVPLASEEAINVIDACGL